MVEPFHIPVMVSEVLDFLKVLEGSIYIDCTLGGGGHTRAILEKGGRVIGIDRDDGAVEYAEDKLIAYRDRFEAHVTTFSNIIEVSGIYAGEIDGVVMDLGVSSRMIDDPSRGFSYNKNGPLLMNMGCSDVNAFEIINTKSKKELSRIFKEYGEERHARKIADSIVNFRSSHPIKTTKELADIVEKSVGGKMPQKSKARIFQALRIYVNDEINELRRGLDGALKVMKTGGRLCVIAYHSLEDRIVKEFMKAQADPCICPPDMPICRCGRSPTMKIITRRAVRASEQEVISNIRSRSALLRVAEKIA